MFCEIVRYFLECVLGFLMDVGFYYDDIILDIAHEILCDETEHDANQQQNVFLHFLLHNEQILSYRIFYFKHIIIIQTRTTAFAH